jgi:hypothetical protein
MTQFELKFEDYDEPNKHGVFADCEAILLTTGKKSNSNHRAASIAEIRVAFTSLGFAWGISLAMTTGGVGYLPNQFHVTSKRVAESRISAIQSAAKEIQSVLDRDFSKDKLAPMVRNWLAEVAA